MWEYIPIYDPLTKIPENAYRILDKSGEIVQYMVRIGANVDKMLDKSMQICMKFRHYGRICLYGSITHISICRYIYSNPR